MNNEAPTNNALKKRPDGRDERAIHEIFSEYGDWNDVGRLKTKLAEYVATVRAEVWRDAITIVHNQAESSDRRAKKIYNDYGKTEEVELERAACETARGIERAMKMAREGVTEEDVAETRNPICYPENH